MNYDDPYGKSKGVRLKASEETLVSNICNTLSWTFSALLKNGVFAVSRLYILRTDIRSRSRSIKTHLEAIDAAMEKSISIMQEAAGSRKTLPDFVQRDFLKPDFVK